MSAGMRCDGGSSMSMPLVSVVVPAFNRRNVIERALDSVFAQTCFINAASANPLSASLQLIVVDDGSSDGTAELLQQRYGDKLRLLQQQNRGVSAARNAGIAKASGEWIALLDSDDAWLPEKLHCQLQALQRDGLPLCHSDEIWIRNGVRVNPMKKHRKRGGWIFEHCLPLCAISPSSALIHRSVFDQLGGFDEDLPACEDYDFWLRYCSRFPVSYVDRALLIKYGGHADQLSRQFHSMDRFRLRSMARLLENTELEPGLRQLCQTELLHKARILMAGAAKHQNTQLQTEVMQILTALRLPLAVETAR